MSTRGYDVINFGFWYDFATYGGAISFITCGNGIPAGFSILSCSAHVIITVLGGTVRVGGSIDNSMTDGLTPAQLLAGMNREFQMGNNRPFASADQNLGIEVVTFPITQGRFVIYGLASVITET